VGEKKSGSNRSNYPAGKRCTFWGQTVKEGSGLCKKNEKREERGCQKTTRGFKGNEGECRGGKYNTT